MNLDKIIASLNAPTTTTNATQLAPINQLGALSNAFGTTPQAIANNVGGILNKIFSGNSSSTTDNTNADGSNTYCGVPTYPTGDIGTVNNSSGTGNIGGMQPYDTNNNGIYTGSYGGMTGSGQPYTPTYDYTSGGTFSRGGLVGVSNLY